jgi:hypothetical protein
VKFNGVKQYVILVQGWNSEDGGSMFLRNNGIHLQIHTASQAEDHFSLHIIVFQINLSIQLESCIVQCVHMGSVKQNH